MTKTQFLHVLTVALAALAGIMAWADKIQTLNIVSPEIAKYWPIMIAGASALRGVVLFLGDWLDDGKINSSFKMLALAGIGVGILFATSGCSSMDNAFRQRVKAVEVNGTAEYDPATQSTRGTASARFELRDPSKDL